MKWTFYIPQKLKITCLLLLFVVLVRYTKVWGTSVMDNNAFSFIQANRPIMSYNFFSKMNFPNQKIIRDDEKPLKNYGHMLSQRKDSVTNNDNKLFIDDKGKKSKPSEKDLNVFERLEQKILKQQINEQAQEKLLTSSKNTRRDYFLPEENYNLLTT